MILHQLSKGVKHHAKYHLFELFGTKSVSFIRSLIKTLHAHTWISA